MVCRPETGDRSAPLWVSSFVCIAIFGDHDWSLGPQSGMRDHLFALRMQKSRMKHHETALEDNYESEWKCFLQIRLVSWLRRRFLNFLTHFGCTPALTKQPTNGLIRSRWLYCLHPQTWSQTRSQVKVQNATAEFKRLMIACVCFIVLLLPFTYSFLYQCYIPSPRFCVSLIFLLRCTGVIFECSRMVSL